MGAVPSLNVVKSLLLLLPSEGLPRIPSHQAEMHWHKGVVLQAMYIHHIHLCKLSLIFVSVQYVEDLALTFFSLFQHTNIQMFP